MASSEQRAVGAADRERRGGGGVERAVGAREDEAVAGVDDAPAEARVDVAGEGDRVGDRVSAPMRLTVPELLERGHDARADRRRRPEDVDAGLGVGAQRGVRLGRQLSRWTNSTGSPALAAQAAAGIA